MYIVHAWYVRFVLKSVVRCVCMCVYVYMCVCVCVYVYMCVCVCLYVCVCVIVCLHLLVSMVCTGMLLNHDLVGVCVLVIFL